MSESKPKKESAWIGEFKCGEDSVWGKDIKFKHGKRIVLAIIIGFGLFVWMSSESESERIERIQARAAPQQDLINVEKFRATGITREIEPFITGVTGYDSILKIDIDRELALSMRTNPLDTKRAVQTWMNVWRGITGEPVVTVDVEWEGIAIATGDFSLFDGDQVKIYD